MGLDNPIHLAFLLVVLLLVFGARRLPEMGRSLGSGMRGFRDALSGESATPIDEHVETPGDEHVETAGDEHVETPGDEHVETAGDERVETPAAGRLAA